jgi:hypothetical protein
VGASWLLRGGQLSDILRSMISIFPTSWEPYSTPCVKIIAKDVWIQVGLKQLFNLMPQA